MTKIPTPMTLDDVIRVLESLPQSGNGLQDLLSTLRQWKKDESNINALCVSLEQYMLNEEVKNEDIHFVCSEFTREVVTRLHAMTVNERLFVMSLDERYYSSTSSRERDLIYAKLLLPPRNIFDQLFD